MPPEEELMPDKHAILPPLRNDNSAPTGHSLNCAAGELPYLRLDHQQGAALDFRNNHHICQRLLGKKASRM